MNPPNHQITKDGRSVFTFSDGRKIETHPNSENPGIGTLIFPARDGVGEMSFPIRFSGDAISALSKGERLPDHCKAY